ncbi:MAG: Rpn family recombination-promoting nuclease/putative transposase [Clostridiales bacterium]|nr:Rpn family recombination-promoting nuclease/putative transposase [Clostridiales bacterium]
MAELPKSTVFNSGGDNSRTGQDIRKEKKEDDVLYPLSDKVFQRWMGDKKICAYFLQSLFGEDFSDIEIDIKKEDFSNVAVNTQEEEFEKHLKLRKIRLDVIARHRNIVIYNIEAQLKHEKDHRDRCLFYACRLISTQLESGDEFGQVKKTVVIFINQSNPNSHSLAEYVSLLDQETKEIFNNKLQIININLNHLDVGINDYRFSDMFSSSRYFVQ